MIWFEVGALLIVAVLCRVCFVKVQDEGVSLRRALLVLAGQVAVVLVVLFGVWASAVDKPRRDAGRAQACLDSGGTPVFVAKGWEFRCLYREVGR